MPVEVVDDDASSCFDFKRAEHLDQFLLCEMMGKQGTGNDIYLLLLKVKIEHIRGFKMNIWKRC